MRGRRDVGRDGLQQASRLTRLRVRGRLRVGAGDERLFDVPCDLLDLRLQLLGELVGGQRGRPQLHGRAGRAVLAARTHLRVRHGDGLLVDFEHVLNVRASAGLERGSVRALDALTVVGSVAQVRDLPAEGRRLDGFAASQTTNRGQQRRVLRGRGEELADVIRAIIRGCHLGNTGHMGSPVKRRE